MWIRRIRPSLLPFALLAAFGLTACPAPVEENPDLKAARAVIAQAIRDLDAGDYRTAKLALEPLLEPAAATRLRTAVPMRCAATCRPSTKHE